jgi:hypothetical protein
VHSALTHKVNAIEAINDRFHAACEGIQSGQLPFLGLLIRHLEVLIPFRLSPSTISGQAKLRAIGSDFTGPHQ